MTARLVIESICHRCGETDRSSLPAGDEHLYTGSARLAPDPPRGWVSVRLDWQGRVSSLSGLPVADNFLLCPGCVPALMSFLRKETR